MHFPENEMRFLNSLPGHAIDVAVDVGAATGSYAWILNRISRQVYAFEPGLVHNAYLNRLNFWSRIEVVAAAVGNCNKTVKFYTPGTDVDALHSATVSAANPVTDLTNTSVREVEQIDLDGYFAQRLQKGQSIDLLKVDVEGYENAVFEGASNLLETHHPMIICEIEARHNHRYAEVFDCLRQLGYVCYFFRDGRFQAFSGSDLSGIQLEKDLSIRLGPEYDSRSNRYINNFLFQHVQSNIKAVI